MIQRFETKSNIQNGTVAASRKKISGDYVPHWHEFYELEYIISGSGSYEVDGISHPVCPGMLFFMTPANFHRVSIRDAEVFNVMFSSSACNSAYLSVLASNPHCTAFTLNGEERVLFESLLTELTVHQCDTEYTALLLDCMTAKLSRPAPQAGGRGLSLSRKIIFYIINHFRSRVTLDEVAAYAGFSPAYVSERFKRETGVNFKEYLNSIRFDYARNLLLCSELSVMQVCSESGFDDYANFIRRFKARFGLSPSRYRRQAGR